MGREAQQTVEF